jgi:hypothetical protein
MAIITASIWTQYTGLAVSGPDLVAVEAWCGAVDAAIRRYLRPYYPEPQTVTLYLDAPPTDVLLVPAAPIRDINELYLNWLAEGVDSRFTPETLLTAGTDYELLRDDPATGWSLSGKVRRLSMRPWGLGWSRERPFQLAPSSRSVRGAVKLVADVGPTEVAADIVGAAASAVTALWRRRQSAWPTSSESWNGYSVSYSTPAIQAAIQSPDVLAVLDHYKPTVVL